MPRFFLPLFAILTFVSPTFAANPFELKDGDRVVFLGSTIIEREQRYGWWELALTLLNRDRNITFRNLGWSGDTVWGEARNGFDRSPKGFERLVSETKKQKPTVIVICYGHNESFAGPSGIESFRTQLEKLIDAVAETKARIILMSPTPFEKSAALPDPTANNANLALYVDAIQAVADQRNLEFINLMTAAKEIPHLTYNGMHMDEQGYRKTAGLLDGPVPDYVSLRKKIIEKNNLVFYQWRPQNITYLFLFRKHEQGNNAKDIAEFDALIVKAESEIQKLKKSIR